MKKNNRRLRLAIRTPGDIKKSEWKKRVQQFLENKEELIKKNGYMIQGVVNGEASFAYTIGRMRSNKREIILHGFNDANVKLIYEAIELLEDGSIELYQPMESTRLIHRSTGESTKFILVHASEEDVRKYMLGIHKELRQNGALVGFVNAPIKIIVADEHNQLPPRLSTKEGLAVSAFDDARFIDEWPRIVISITG